MRAFSLLLVANVFALPVNAETLQIHGVTGYAGEYELSGTASRQDLNGARTFSGPLTVKHVGLCTRDGPKESVSEIRVDLDKRSSRITATLDFEGSKCTYRGVFSESYHGFMDCGRDGSFPLRIWTQ